MNPISFTFKKAARTQAKARLAIDGPSGSGKTYTALIAAQALADSGHVAVIDTEHGSASLYSDIFSFDVLELDRFDPRVYIQAINAAEQAGYSVIVIDSLSHAWEGEGGTLDIVDQIGKRSYQGNNFAAWKDATPIQRQLVETMLKSPCHIIATMRTKTEWILETNDRGKSVPRKVGLAPVQRQGIEYEFQVVADMDVDHNLIVSKTRCNILTDAVVNRPPVSFFDGYVAWLKSGEPASPPSSNRIDQILKETGFETPEKSNGNGEAKPRSWAASQIKPLVENGIARDTRHAVNILNHSFLDPRTATPPECLAWAINYRNARDAGSETLVAAQQVNG